MSDTTVSQVLQRYEVQSYDSEAWMNPEDDGGYVTYADHQAAIATMQKELAEREQPPASKGLVAIPKGYVLVPLQLTKEMELVLEDEWQWEDLLAAAGSITEEQYQQASMKV